MTLSRRLTVFMVAVPLATALIIAVAVDFRIQGNFARSELERQGALAARLADDLASQIGDVRADVALAANVADIRDIVLAAGDGAPVPEALVATVVHAYRAMLLAKPTYLQVRIIGVADGGRELVRVDRVRPGSPVRVVAAADLQPKGDRDYFRATIGLPAGAMYVSSIDLNQERGVVEVPHLPVLRAATPIVAASGKALGLVIINVEMLSALDRLRADAGSQRRLFVVDAGGGYVMHPDRTREFAAARGQTARLQDEFPALADLLAADGPVLREIEVGGRHYAVAAAPVALAGDTRAMVLSMIPSERATLSGYARRTTLLTALAAAIVAAGGAYLIARTVTRPLGQMARAAQRFLEDGSLPLPSRSEGEVGVLAKALQRLYTTLSERNEALARQEERFRLVVEAAPDAMVTVDQAGRIALVNRRAEALFGYERQELVGQPVEVLVPERMRAQHRGLVQSTLARMQTRTLGARPSLAGLRKDGKELPLEIGLASFETRDGVCTLATIVDATERRRAQEWFRAIVEAAPNAKIVVDRDGRIALVNRAAEVLFGYPREELLGRPIESLLPARIRGVHPGHVAAFFRAPVARPMGVGRELYGVRKDGSEVPLEIGLSPMEGPDGVATLASVIDITQRKRASDELKRSNAELEQFAYVASHDLQEPLRMVANYTELLAERYRGRLDEKADKYIHYASDGARRMQRLVADLLAYSRVGSQGKALVPVATDAVFAAVLDSLGAAVREAGAVVEAGPLPRVLADETQVRQLFQNLLSNAVKFRGEAPPRVAVRATREGRDWLFSVADNGIGMEMRYAERIFQMFQRLHERGRFDGSGIGLAIAKRIVERHGGRIWVESNLGAGATFYFTLRDAQDQS